ncbi:uncharacterized protein LOC105690207 isoform X3 [Athalia rosae]|uniref:uncharacterized protein LOC105690207 isoform X3 n=1 Tax=Athalia rosae TaxID=37344 RepID=UPI0006256D8F|nr:uncharacterized protein LOC105690207 isoform X3 [Athalia rosae]
MGLATVSAFLALMAMQFSLLRAHREHKVHNIVLYPDKHSWCKTTPIKQVVTWPKCSSQELDNNVCVGACFSYMVPHSEPSAPGDLIRPYCDSCQPLDSIWHTVTLDCKDEDGKPTTMQKKVQIITNCSCGPCTETSRIRPDYNTLLQSLADENLDQNVNVVEEEPDLLLNPNINASKINPTDTIVAQENFVQLIHELKSTDVPDESKSKAKELVEKLTTNELDLEKLKEMLEKYEEEAEQKHKPHHGGLLHIGPHHSLVLDSDVKEKIDVEPHHLHPAVAGQEISYHDNVLVEKDKKKDF